MELSKFMKHKEREVVTLLTPDFEGSKVFVFGSQNRRKKSLRRNGFSVQKRYICQCFWNRFPTAMFCGMLS